MTPLELVDRALGLLLAKDMERFAGLWSEDGVLEFPFAAPGYPARVSGRIAIAEYLRDYPSIVDVREIAERRVHQTVDPAVVVAEFDATGVVVATGSPYLMRYIAVITVRDNEIHCYRDYWSPLAAAEAMGGSAALTATFGGSDA